MNQISHPSNFITSQKSMKKGINKMETIRIEKGTISLYHQITLRNSPCKQRTNSWHNRFQPPHPHPHPKTKEKNLELPSKMDTQNLIHSRNWSTNPLIPFISPNKEQHFRTIREWGNSQNRFIDKVLSPLHSTKNMMIPSTRVKSSYFRIKRTNLIKLIVYNTNFTNIKYGRINYSKFLRSL